ncbi:MAG: pyridoxal phosphate-dependent transferase [Benniella sp.]|nr:MAG: pyridoxal phosphate-dependent transferase [Benniella sp.]
MEGSIELETITQHQLEQRLAEAQAKGHNNHRSATSHHPSPPPSPTQCNFGGRRFPLSWAAKIKDQLDTSKSKTLVLLDAASYAMTSELDLSDHATSPDFVVVSFYKMFGFPTGLGAVIIKTELGPKLNKKYFGGGTVSAIASDEPWQVYRTSLHGRFEDGTLNYMDIVAVDLAFESIRAIYGDYSNISPHVTALHRFLRSNGNWIGYGDVERLASMKNIHLRTGGFCNPGSMQRWLDLSAEEVKKNLETGHVCWDDTDILNGKPTGSIRVTLSACRLYYPFRRRLGKGSALIMMLLKSKVRLLVKGWDTNTTSILRWS